jgi:hypothetical protein
VKKSFIIYSPEYTDSVGGIIVLHKLASILSMNYEVYITSKKTINGSKANLIDVLSVKRLVSIENIIPEKVEYIVIYPETIIGNPLNAEKVIRWILYHPGVLGGDKIYNEKEIIFTYSKYFVKNTIYENVPELFVFESKIDKFFNKNEERNTNCYLIKKGKSKYPQINMLYNKIQSGVLVDNMLNSNNIDYELNELFNKSVCFLSYDDASYHSIQAALSGCLSIVVPTDNIKKEEWIEKQPLMKYGVAYGFEEIQHAENTIHLVKDYLIELENYSNETIKNMITQV